MDNIETPLPKTKGFTKFIKSEAGELIAISFLIAIFSLVTGFIYSITEVGFLETLKMFFSVSIFSLVGKGFGLMLDKVGEILGLFLPPTATIILSSVLLGIFVGIVFYFLFIKSKNKK